MTSGEDKDTQWNEDGSPTDAELANQLRGVAKELLCPHDPWCATCECSAEDDACFPDEAVRALKSRLLQAEQERDEWKEQTHAYGRRLDKFAADLEQAESSNEELREQNTEKMAVIELLAGHLAAPEEDCDCHGEGLDYEGDE